MPALAAGMTNHHWTMGDLWHDWVSLPAWMAPTHRGRPSWAARAVPVAPLSLPLAPVA